MGEKGGDGNGMESKDVEGVIDMQYTFSKTRAVNRCVMSIGVRSLELRHHISCQCEVTKDTHV